MPGWLLFLILLIVGYGCGYAKLYEIPVQTISFGWLVTVGSSDEKKNNFWPPLSEFRRKNAEKAIDEGNLSAAVLIVFLGILFGLVAAGLFSLILQNWKDVANREIKEVIVDVILVGPIFVILCNKLHHHKKSIKERVDTEVEEGAFGEGSTNDPQIDGSHKALVAISNVFLFIFGYLFFVILYLFPVVFGFALGYFEILNCPILNDLRDFVIFE